MTQLADLAKTVGFLIATGKEGDHWDFKHQHHEKAGDLIKDIICLANSPRHRGDRFIIFGVADDGSMVGLRPDGHRRTQADIVNTLASTGFAGGVYPDVHLEGLEIQECGLEVLVIKDRPEKPYFLPPAPLRSATPGPFRSEGGARAEGRAGRCAFRALRPPRFRTETARSLWIRA